MIEPKFEDQYPFVVNDIMQNIEKKKKQGSKDSLIDIIMDYCLKEGLDVNLVGDAIKSDVYFMSFIEKDCEAHRIFKAQKADEW